MYLKYAIFHKNPADDYRPAQIYGSKVHSIKNYICIHRILLSNEMAFNPSFLPDLLFKLFTGAGYEDKNLP